MSKSSSQGAAKQIGLNRTIEQAQVFHRKGQFADAERHYRMALAQDPANAGVLRLMGVLAHEAGRNDRAIEMLQRALDVDPDYSTAHRNLAHVFALEGKNLDALHHYSEAARLDPADINALIEAARLQSDVLGNYEAALSAYDQGLRSAPNDARLHRGRGKMLAEMDRPDEAIAALAEAARLAPGDGIVAYHQGTILARFGHTQEAADAFGRAAELNPTDAETWIAYGNALAAIKEKQKAVDALSRAIELTPDAAIAYTNIGNILADEAMLNEAIGAHLRAIELAPDLYHSYVNLGSALQTACRPEEALPAYQKAAELNPGHDGILWNLALCLLSVGRLEGWDIYGFGFSSGQRKPMRPFPGLLWEGQDLSDKTIMIWREQGVGDDLRFSTVIPELIAEAGHVIVETEPRLVDLYRRSWPEATVRVEQDRATGLGNYPEDEIDFDFTAPAGIAASLRRRTLDAFPARARPLVACPEKRAAARAWLESLGQGPKVGLTWRSGLRNPVRNIFATDLQDWARLQEIEGLKLINLQFGDPQDEIREAAEKHGLTIHEMPGLDTHNDLDGTAALTAELDFVTGLWNAAAEMTGALGVPGLFYMPAHHPMQIGTGTLPWHPTLHIYPVMPGFDRPELIGRILSDARALLGSART
ncbi:tetratricopeptide repeat protein [Parvibaculum sp.]|uniref:tetratricopeptide repeat protein n=1 Tax=Parvibaculum sp. TaxID=2024848 RepID=UPI00320EF246